MKTLIVYATKHGCTENCSFILKDKLIGDVITVNIKKDILPDITSFDNIIIGGSIYAGKIQKEISEFCTKNLNALKNKKVGLFICGMQNGDMAETQLNNSFPEELVAHAAAKKPFGGEFIFKKMNLIERFIVKIISKTKEDVSSISTENIDEFVKFMNTDL